MTTELLERRALAALRFVHAVTGAPIMRPLSIKAPGLRLMRNLSGLTVVLEARGHEAYSNAFEAPPKLGAGDRNDFGCSVHDPAGEFLPREFTLTLPRPTRGIDEPPELAAGAAADAAIELRLLPAAALPAAPAWALLRLAVHVRGSSPPRGIGNVWVEAQPRVPGKPLRLAQTDAQGEALVVVPDVGPVSGAAPLAAEFEVDLTLVLDPLLVRAAADDASDRTPLPLGDESTRPARRGALRIETLTRVPMRAGDSRRHIVALDFP
jgi:hypothetical protein